MVSIHSPKDEFYRLGAEAISFPSPNLVPHVRIALTVSRLSVGRMSNMLLRYSSVICSFTLFI